MSKQRTRNIRMLAVVAILLATSIAINLVKDSGNDSLDLDRAKFIIKNTIDVTHIKSLHQNVETEITFTGGRWLVNNAYQADPSRVHLLFAALQQAQIRRPASSDESSSLTRAMDSQGHRISFGDGQNTIGSIETYGDEESNLTWFRDDEGIYLMEIPGYRTFVHGIIAIDPDSWRNHNLFHRMRWNNLKGLTVNFPSNDRTELKIEQGPEHLVTKGISATDTTKLYDYIDYISLLNAERYLVENEVPDDVDVDVKIDVRDIGDRPYTLEILSQRDREGNRIGRMDSSIYFTLSEERVTPLLVAPDYFARQDAN